MAKRKLGASVFPNIVQIEGREPDLSAPLGVTTEINLHFPALLPPTYCSDVHERLVLYKRLANCEDEASLVVLQEELIDRFGLLPDGAEGLLACHRMRIAARPIGITKVDASDRAVTLQFEPTPAVDSQTIIGLVQNNRHWKLAGPAKLRIEIASSTLPERVQVVRGVIAQLMKKPLPAAVATPATTKKR